MKTIQEEKNRKRARRAHRVRQMISRGTAERPRLRVSRSLRYLFAQVIDDTVSQTLIGVHSKKLKTLGTKTDMAKKLGKLLADCLKEKGIKKLVFDRGPYRYHGRIQAFADVLRQEGIDF